MKITRCALVLLLLYALCYLIPLEFRALWQPDEMRYAEISREMLTSGNWTVPHFLGLRYFEKPVAGYWINNLSQWLLGDSNFAVRFGSVLSVTLSALLVYWLALRLWQQRATALLAAVIFLSCLLVYAVGTYAAIDPMITLWLVAAMCSFWRVAEAQRRSQAVAGWLMLGLACGMGFMTKGFLALAVPVVAIVPWAIAARRFKELLLYGPLALLSAALLSAPWALSIARQEPDFWHYFFWVEHVQRFAEENAQHKAPFWYYLPVLAGGAVPWLGLLPGALRQGWTGPEPAKTRYLLSWVLMPLLFFSVAKGKLPTYILPCFAPLAILMAHHARHLAARGGRALRVNGVLNLLFGTLLALVVLTVLAPWSWVHHPVYGRAEWNKILLAASAFLFWALTGVVTLVAGARHWRLAALCPLGVVLATGMVLPDRVTDVKQPQAFLAAIGPDLANSRYLLANGTGMASALAWQLKRSDVRLLGDPGELSYGVSYADGAGRRVTREAFPDWLRAHRRSGSVSLVIKLAKSRHPDDLPLPPPDRVCQQGRVLWYLYKQQP